MKYKVSKIIRNEILHNDTDYDYIYSALEINYIETLQGILNSLKHLLRHIEDEDNSNKIDNIILLLNTYVDKNNKKKELEHLNNKVEEFINNLSLSFNKDKLNDLKKNIDSLVNIQNKCILNPNEKYKNDKSDFINYLIFEKKDISLLGKYLLNNIKDLLINNKILTSVFTKIIKEYMSLEEDNTFMINYYNQVINLFLNGKLYDHLFKDDSNHFLEVLKKSNKYFVWELINKIENNLLISEDKLSRDYNISLKFPDNLEEYNYFENGRVDLTSQNVLTIDSEEDTCLDDALYIEENNDGTYTLYIHLANPTSIIPYESNTMKEALKRCETIYLLDKEIPIYKDELSYNILSILPNKKTNVLTFKIPISTDYSVILDRVEVFSSVIQNKNKLSYDEVDSILWDPKDDELSKKILLLSEVFNKLSRSQLKILAYHKLENMATGNTKNNSNKSDLSGAHMIVENSMIFVNRLPDILDRYYGLNLVLPYRVQREYNEHDIDKLLEQSRIINKDSPYFRKALKSYFPGGYYSHINTGHIGLGVDGYVRISSAARRAMDDLAIYAFNDLYLNRDDSNLDIKYYFWEEEIKYWCEYANNRIIENNNFANEYNYLYSKGKILKK